MDFSSFRDHLNNLEKNGLLIRVRKEVNVKFEIAAGIRKTSDIVGPALLFERIKGYLGWRVVGGLFATQQLLAFALKTENKDQKIFKRYLEFDQQRIIPVLVSSSPAKDIIIKGDDIDLYKLPIPTYSEMDSGPYLTAGVEISKHPDTKVQDISIQRRVVFNKNTLGLMLAPAGHLGLMIRAAHEKGQPIGVATAIGCDPALSIASQCRSLVYDDRIEIAGAISGKPIELIRCETIDVEVPANSEIIIEGVIDPGPMTIDGPFGEFPGNYVSLGNYLTSKGTPTADGCYSMKVTAITMRKDAIFQALLSGIPTTENHILKKWSLAAGIYRLLSQIVPSPEHIKGINITNSSGGYHVIVSIQKVSETTPRNIIRTLLSSGILIGLVIVVDDDIDINNPQDVEWAIATRMQPDRDIIIFPSIDPRPEALIQNRIDNYKWGLDATMPITKDKWMYKKAVPPGVDKIDYI